MKKAILGSAIALSILSTAVLAQVSANIPIGQPEQASIKEYVVKEKVKPTMIKEKVSVGSTLDTDVDLAPVPSDWGPSVSKYRYVYTNDHVVLVEPSTRRVVHIIE